MKGWKRIRDGQCVELGLIQIDIVGHSQIRGNDRDLQEAKGIFRTQMETIVYARGGKLFNWAGDGGSFMFLIRLYPN